MLMNTVVCVSMGHFGLRAVRGHVRIWEGSRVLMERDSDGETVWVNNVENIVQGVEYDALQALFGFFHRVPSLDEIFAKANRAS